MTSQLETSSTGCAAIQLADRAAPTLSWRDRLSALTRFRGGAVLATLFTQFAIYAVFPFQAALLARMLDPAARGEYAAAVFYCQLLNYLGLMGVIFAVARRAAQPDCDLTSLSRGALRAGAITGLASLALIAGVLAWVALPASKAYLAPLCVVCGLMLPAEHMRLALLSTDQRAGAFGRYNAHRLLAALVFPLSLFPLWWWDAGTPSTVAWLWAFSSLPGLLLYLATARRAAPWRPANPNARTLIREGLPDGASLLAADIFNRVDVFLMVQLADRVEQGLYAAAVPAAFLLLVAPNGLTIFAFNHGAKRGEPPNPRKLMLAALAVALLQVAAAGLYALALEPLMLLVFRERFAGAVHYAYALLPATLVAGVSLVGDGYLRGRNKSWIGVFARMAATPVMLLSCWALYAEWGLLAIPLSSLPGQLCVLAVVSWAIWQDLRERRREAGPSDGSLANSAPANNRAADDSAKNVSADTTPREGA